MKVWNKLLKFFRRLDPNIDWKFWEVAFDFGANTKFYELGEFCACRHRYYNHTVTREYILMGQYTALHNGCSQSPCPCKEFIVMDQFQYVEYAREQINLIQSKSEWGYDYNRAVEKGRQIRT